MQSLQNAPNLTVLDIDNNSLDTFPDNVLNMKRLKTLNIANNAINNLPAELSLLDSLYKLNIEGNPLKSIQSSLRTGSTEALKKHLKMKYRNGIN